MFDNNAENEDNFCEAYKSQILGNGVTEKESSFNTLSKILTILLLLVIIIVVSIYGYTYINNNSEFTPPTSMQTIDDDELIVTEEEPIGKMPPEAVELDKEDNKSTKKEKAETLLKVPSNAQVAYLEELAQLSEEIDKDGK